MGGEEPSLARGGPIELDGGGGDGGGGGGGGGGGRKFRPIRGVRPESVKSLQSKNPKTGLKKRQKQKLNLRLEGENTLI